MTHPFKRPVKPGPWTEEKRLAEVKEQLARKTAKKRARTDLGAMRCR